MKIVATNKKAFHDYFVIDSFEAGINLVGCEVKSVRAGEVNLKDSYAVIRGGQLVLVSAYIKNYDKGSFSNVDSRRDRRLLMHRQEIMRLLGKVKEKGFSLVPLKMYLNGSLVKVEIGLVKGKQLYDKKKAIAEKDAERDKQRQLADMKRLIDRKQKKFQKVRQNPFQPNQNLIEYISVVQTSRKRYCGSVGRAADS